jgi:hypothetical protein
VSPWCVVARGFLCQLVYLLVAWNTDVSRDPVYFNRYPSCFKSLKLVDYTVEDILPRLEPRSGV